MRTAIRLCPYIPSWRAHGWLYLYQQWLMLTRYKFPTPLTYTCFWPPVCQNPRLQDCGEKSAGQMYWIGIYRKNKAIDTEINNNQDRETMQSIVFRCLPSCKEGSRNNHSKFCRKDKTSKLQQTSLTFWTSSIVSGLKNPQRFGEHVCFHFLWKRKRKTLRAGPFTKS